MAQGVGLQITTTPSNLAEVSKDAQKGIFKAIPRAVLRTGVEGLDIILSRTKRGQGADGPFKEYTPSYMKALKNKGKPTSPVDLFNTGQMVRSMQTRRKDKRTAEIYFSNPFAAKKAAFNDKTRPFFGFNRQEEKALGEFFRKQL